MTAATLRWRKSSLCSPRHYEFLIRYTPASSLTSASQWLIERVHSVFVTDTLFKRERAKRNRSCHSQISCRRGWIVYGSYLERRFLYLVFRSRGIWRETERSRRGEKIRDRERRRRKQTGKKWTVLRDKFNVNRINRRRRRIKVKDVTFVSSLP